MPYGKRVLLLACSVYLHPAGFEAFELSVIEVMAAGLKSIVKMTGAKDLVKQANPSLIVLVDVDGCCWLAYGSIHRHSVHLELSNE
jgi:hypothetical protein